MSEGHVTALEIAVRQARAAEAAAGERQGDLFALGQALDTRPSSAPRGPGRPPGSRNLSTLTAAKFYMAEAGDPLRRGVHIAALPILAMGVLEGLAARLGCSRFEAAKWWSGIYAATLPFTHQRLGQLEVRAPGAPGSGDPIVWSFSDTGEIVDVLPEPTPTPALNGADISDG